eukprot:700980-Lingulodinium_polyedra.AAC.1
MTPQLQHAEKQWKTKRRQQAFEIPITPLSSFNVQSPMSSRSTSKLNYIIQQRTNLNRILSTE